MKLFIAIIAFGVTLIPIGVGSADQYADASAKMEEVISGPLGLAAFRPSVIMTDSEIHITLSPTQQGDYPTFDDVKRIIELYYKILDDTGYAGSLVLVINNLDGIGAYRWFMGLNSREDFYSQPNYVMNSTQQLNPGHEGIAGSADWVYRDPAYVGTIPAAYS